jgi:hypothetical protein
MCFQLVLYYAIDVGICKFEMTWSRGRNISESGLKKSKGTSDRVDRMMKGFSLSESTL